MIVFDLDGTLADDRWRRNLIPEGANSWHHFHPYHEQCDLDTPCWHVVEICKHLLALTSGPRIEIWTGRGEEQRGKTLYWLRQHIGHDFSEALRMRQIGSCVSGYVIKQDWCRQFGPPSIAIEDDPLCIDMYRQNGVAVLPVNLDWKRRG